MTFWQRDHAWFAAIAPAEEPEIAVVVLNEHGGHGASEAAPTAAAIIHKFFELKRGDANASIAASTSLLPVPLPPSPPPPAEARPSRATSPGPAPEETHAAVQARPLARMGGVTPPDSP